jgi:hypothetical protein
VFTYHLHCAYIELIVFIFIGTKYFGVVKYFFRLHYTSAVQNIPICAVQWLNFEVVKDAINCCIGRIPQLWWNRIDSHPALKNKSFVAFSDLQPSRYALSYIPESNNRATYIKVAFIALDSEKLGEHVNDTFEIDFGDNKFPYYLGNRKTKIVDEETNDQEADNSTLSVKQFVELSKYIPKSILEYLTS